MSRSTRKTPVFGNTTSESEKQDKRRANRALRRVVQEQLQRGQQDRAGLPLQREQSNVYSFDKDGKKYAHPKADSARYETLHEEMRK